MNFIVPSSYSDFYGFIYEGVHVSRGALLLKNVIPRNDFKYSNKSTYRDFADFGSYKRK